MSSVFLIFFFSHLCMVASASLKILYSFCMENTSTIFTFWTSIFYPPFTCTKKSEEEEIPDKEFIKWL
jgi:putative lipase involved disintegration of autophagic bodies